MGAECHVDAPVFFDEGIDDDGERNGEQNCAHGIVGSGVKERIRK